jgi:hypothetical protein
MRLDLDTYAVNRKPIQGWYRSHSDQDIRSVIANWAISTHCPCIILCFFMAEDIGYTPELLQMIDSLSRFYGYTEILNQKEGSPYLTGRILGDIK